MEQKIVTRSDKRRLPLVRSLCAGFALLLVSIWSLQPEGGWAQNAGTANPAPTENAPAADAAGAAQDDRGVVYTQNLKSIEERVNALKEKVFRSKARLFLLRETVLSGVVSGAKGVLFHVNQLGQSYTLVSMTYFLDGTKIYSRADVTGELSKRDELKIFEGSIPSGNHQVTVNLELRGNGFGVFSYLNGYKFKVQGNCNFIAEEGKVSRLRIISYEKGGLQRNFLERPAFRCDLVTDRSLPSGTDNAEAQ